MLNMMILITKQNILIKDIKKKLKQNLKQYMQHNSKSNSRWMTNISWLGSKISNITRIWSSQYNRPSNHLPHHKQIFKNTQNILTINKKEQNIEVIDPKAKMLAKLRQGNLNQTLQQKIKKVSQYFQKSQIVDKPDDLRCPICLQFFIKPVVTVCGHSFCLRCLDQTLLFKADCPNCRNYLRGTKIIQCQSIHKIILRVIQKYPQQQIQLYNQSQSQANQWLKSRTLQLQNIQNDTKIDVKDTQYIWCKAIIKQLYYNGNTIKSIKVHYQGWNPIYDQIIQINSDRLANYGFYTNRQTIPHYRNNLNTNMNMLANQNYNGSQQVMYSYVVNNSQQLPFGMGGVSGMNNFMFYSALGNNMINLQADSGVYSQNSLQNIQQLSQQQYQYQQQQSLSQSIQLSFNQSQHSYSHQYQHQYQYQHEHEHLYQQQQWPQQQPLVQLSHLANYFNNNQYFSDNQNMNIQFLLNTNTNPNYLDYNPLLNPNYQNTHNNQNQDQDRQQNLYGQYSQQNYQSHFGYNGYVENRNSNRNRNIGGSNMLSKIQNIQLQVQQYNVHINNLLANFQNKPQLSQQQQQQQQDNSIKYQHKQQNIKNNWAIDDEQSIKLIEDIQKYLNSQIQDKQTKQVVDIQKQQQQQQQQDKLVKCITKIKLNPQKIDEQYKLKEQQRL